MGDSPLGAALNPSVNPNISNVMTCQVNIARDHRSHPFRFSFLEQKVFSVLKKICFPGEDCGDSGSELGGPGCHHHILPRSAHGKQLGNAHGEEETVIVSPFVDTGICTVRHSPGLSRMCQCA